jgi:hypothetical protein
MRSLHLSQRTTTSRAGQVWRVLAWAAGAAVLAAVFLAYLDPDLAFDLASRAWACF